jgi:hypothetical protein
MTSARNFSNTSLRRDRIHHKIVRRLAVVSRPASRMLRSSSWIVLASQPFFASSARKVYRSSFSELPREPSLRSASALSTKTRT